VTPIVGNVLIAAPYDTGLGVPCEVVGFTPSRRVQIRLMEGGERRSLPAHQLRYATATDRERWPNAPFTREEGGGA